MNRDCVIGYTGFIGNHLLNFFNPSEKYNSSNIHEIMGKIFDTIYFAGNYGVKWQANTNPLNDRQNIHSIVKKLSYVKAKRFILISTIDVYSNPVNVDENFLDTSKSQSSYGLHRSEFEDFVRKSFQRHNILRLPVVFGRGFKKNVIFDMLNNNETTKINPTWKMQFYYVNNLKKDINLIVANNIETINIATEPIKIDELAKTIFNLSLKGNEKTFSTDMKSKYDYLFNQSNGYLYSKNAILNEIKCFVHEEKEH
jgi:nucleoside-diphosphate-sugar epimerase